MTKHPAAVTYDRLVYNPEINARGGAETDVTELAATIKADGLGQPLLVRPAKRGNKYEIAEGGRRWRAIGLLIKAGDWPKDDPIPIFPRDLTDAEALELSLSTSITRLPLGPAEEAIAFTRLQAEHGKTNVDIAATFGIPERRVAQRLALGSLHPPILEALKAGDIKLDVAQAFTLTPDVKRQAKLWKDFAKSGGQTKHWVRRALTDQAIDAGRSREAKLVGEEAYLAAGGSIRRDLFGEDVWYEDGALLNKLFEEKLSERVAAFEAEGWSFVHVARESNDPAQYSWSTLTPKTEPLAEDAKRLKAIERELKALDKQLEERRDAEEFDDEKIEQLEDIAEKLEAERAQLESKGFTDRQKAASGVVIAFNYQGDMIVTKGKTKPSKAKEARKAKRNTRTADRDADDGTGDAGVERDEEADLSGAVLADLAGVMGGAIQMAIVEKPGQALRLTLAAMIMKLKSFDHVPFQLQSHNYSSAAPEFKSIITELLRDAEGKDFAQTLDHLDTLDEDQHHKLLAILLANALDWRTFFDATQMALIRRLDPDCGRRFNADEAYFNRLKRAQLVDALADVDPVDAKAREKRKKPELVARCLEVLPPLGWLPAPLRAPSYAGPGSAAFADARCASLTTSPIPSVGEGDAASAASGEGAHPQLEAAE